MTVELRGVTKRYFSKGQEIVAVRNVDLKVGDGELFVLLGPSGCGKTTILRIIAGLVEPDEGEVLINGKVVNGVYPSDRNVAMVFQNYALYPHMNVYDNIALNMKVRKIKKEEIDRRVREVAAKLQIAELLSKRPKELSGGQAQRVALARAMVRNPSVYLMDEPLSNLDAKLRVEMRAELKKLHRVVEAPIIYVTHDQVEAMTLGDRIAVMNKGVIQQVGTPMELYTHPKNTFVAGFLGTPPMNIIPAEELSGLDGLEKLSPTGSLSGLSVGFRPGDVSVGEGPLSFDVEVEYVELLGDDVLVHAKKGLTKMVIRTAASGYVEQSTLRVRLDSSKLYWFNKDGETLVREVS
ncbi:MAG: ABC transporter ATP-binding protein [Thermoprotei archaeon]